MREGPIPARSGHKDIGVLAAGFPARGLTVAGRRHGRHRQRGRKGGGAVRRLVAKLKPYADEVADAGSIRQLDRNKSAFLFVAPAFRPEKADDRSLRRWQDHNRYYCCQWHKHGEIDKWIATTTHLHLEHDKRDDVDHHSDDQQRQEKAGVVLGQGLTADRAVIDLLSIPTKQPALPAARTAALHAAPNSWPCSPLFGV